MFMSLTNSFSVQTIHPVTGCKMSWISIKDKEALLKYLSKMAGDIYRVAGVNYLGSPCMVTHKYCERMIWGNEAFGKGLKHES